MGVKFLEPKREGIWLLAGFAGGTGSGKTFSALRFARGIAGGKVFAAIDTENGRMNHYADEFPEMRRGALGPPFRPDAYTVAIKDAVAFLEAEKVPLANRVVLVDSASHEWAGDGGCLDWHAEITKGDAAKSAAGWARVKPAHKKMVTQLLNVQAHVILCFRAEPKIDIVRKQDGSLEFVPKEAPAKGLDGWLPISEKMLPYEMTVSFMLMADAPGIPKPIKLEAQHQPFVPLDQPIDEEVGAKFGAWARGDDVKPKTRAKTKPAQAPEPAGDDLTAPEPEVDEITTLAATLVGHIERAGGTGKLIEKVRENAAAGNKAWLEKQIGIASKWPDKEGKAA